MKCSQFVHGKLFSPRLGQDMFLQGSGEHDPGEALPQLSENKQGITKGDIWLS